MSPKGEQHVQKKRRVGAPAGKSEAESSPNRFNKLSTDVVHSVESFLDYKSLVLGLRHAAKRFNKNSHDDSLWRNLLKAYFGLELGFTAEQPKASEEKSSSSASTPKYPHLEADFRYQLRAFHGKREHYVKPQLKRLFDLLRVYTDNYISPEYGLHWYHFCNSDHMHVLGKIVQEETLQQQVDSILVIPDILAAAVERIKDLSYGETVLYSDPEVRKKVTPDQLHKHLPWRETSIFPIYLNSDAESFVNWEIYKAARDLLRSLLLEAKDPPWTPQAAIEHLREIKGLESFQIDLYAKNYRHRGLSIKLMQGAKHWLTREHCGLFEELMKEEKQEAVTAFAKMQHLTAHQADAYREVLSKDLHATLPDIMMRKWLVCREAVVWFTKHIALKTPSPEDLAIASRLQHLNEFQVYLFFSFNHRFSWGDGEEVPRAKANINFKFLEVHQKLFPTYDHCYAFESLICWARISVAEAVHCLQIFNAAQLKLCDKYLFDYGLKVEWIIKYKDCFDLDRVKLLRDSNILDFDGKLQEKDIQALRVLSKPQFRAYALAREKGLSILSVKKLQQYTDPSDNFDPEWLVSLIEHVTVKVACELVTGRIAHFELSELQGSASLEGEEGSASFESEGGQSSGSHTSTTAEAKSAPTTAATVSASVTQVAPTPQIPLAALMASQPFPPPLAPPSAPIPPGGGSQTLPILQTMQLESEPSRAFALATSDDQLAPRTLTPKL